MSLKTVINVLLELNWNFEIPIQPSGDWIVKIAYAFINKNIWNGMTWSILVDQNDNVFAMGDNSCGQIGLGHNQSIDGMVKLDYLCGKNICEFYEGNGCVFARSKDYCIYVWGWNHWAQLGIGEISEDKVYKTPQINEFLNDIQTIRCGDLHYLALSNTGIVYGWGVNCEGQLSTSIEESIVSKPVKLFGQTSFKIIYTNCFSNCSLAIDSNGNILVWGHSFLQDLDDDSALQYVDEFIVFDGYKFDKAIVLDNAIYGISDYKLYNYDKGQFDEISYLNDNVKDITVDWKGCLIIQTPTQVFKMTNELVDTGYKTIGEYFLNDFHVTYGTFEIEHDFKPVLNDIPISNPHILDLVDESERMPSLGCSSGYGSEIHPLSIDQTNNLDHIDHIPYQCFFCKSFEMDYSLGKSNYGSFERSLRKRMTKFLAGLKPKKRNRSLGITRKYPSDYQMDKFKIEPIVKNLDMIKEFDYDYINEFVPAEKLSPESGDIIEFRQGNYSHFAIYFTSDRVIHIKYSQEYKHYIYESERIEEIAKGFKCRINNLENEAELRGLHPLDKNKIRINVFSKLDRIVTVRKNQDQCLLFVTKCRFGKKFNIRKLKSYSSELSVDCELADDYSPLSKRPQIIQKSHSVFDFSSLRIPSIFGKMFS